MLSTAPSYLYETIADRSHVIASSRKIRKIGAGSFGTVWLVHDHVSNANLVMKEVSLRGLPLKEQRATKNEVRVLQRLQHPHIISYVDSFVHNEKLCICMNWASGGDLGTQISQHKRSGKRFLEVDVIKCCYQVSSALAYCHHTLKLLHRDLKPANIFINANGEYLLGDFGISRFLATSGALAQTRASASLGPSNLFDTCLENEATRYALMLIHGSTHLSQLLRRVRHPIIHVA